MYIIPELNKYIEWLFRKIRNSLAISWREQVTFDGMMMMNVRFVKNNYYEIKSVVKAA